MLSKNVMKYIKRFVNLAAQKLPHYVMVSFFFVFFLTSFLFVFLQHTPAYLSQCWIYNQMHYLWELGRAICPPSPQPAIRRRSEEESKLPRLSSSEELPDAVLPNLKGGNVWGNAESLQISASLSISHIYIMSCTHINTQQQHTYTCHSHTQSCSLWSLILSCNCALN